MAKKNTISARLYNFMLDYTILSPLKDESIL
jgi:hypothetical protein